MNNGESIHGLPIRIGSSTSVQCFNASAASHRTLHNILMHLTGCSGLRPLLPAGDAGRYAADDSARHERGFQGGM
jgi:hypothetical protein